MPNGNSKDYAVVIGIDAYSGLRPLKSAVSDANEFMKWLREVEGLNGPGQIIPILGDTFYSHWIEAKPNRDSIDKALVDLGILKGKKIGRRLYFYFSGHGFTNTSTDVGMVMANAAIGYLTNSVSMKGCHAIFRDIGFFDEVIFILDCCRENTVYSDTPPAPAANLEYLKMIFKPNAGVAHVPAVRDLFVLATGYGDQALAPVVKDIGERRGLLTKALIEGLAGKAALENGEITAASLRAFIESRVKELAIEINAPQEAQIDDSNSKGMVLKNVPIPQIEVHIKIDPSIKGDLVLYDKQKTIFTSQEIAANNSVWVLNLIKRPAPYFLESTDPVQIEKLDLAAADENKPYEFPFPQSK